MKRILLCLILLLGCLTASSSDRNNLDIRWTLINEGLGD